MGVGMEIKNQNMWCTAASARFLFKLIKATAKRINDKLLIIISFVYADLMISPCDTKSFEHLNI